MYVKVLENSGIILTDHVLEQSQKRGIPFELIVLLHQYGERKHDNHGCVIRFFKKNTVEKRLGEELYEKNKALLNDHLEVYLVESIINNLCVVTVGHKTKRRRDKPSHKFSESFVMKKHYITKISNEN